MLEDERYLRTDAREFGGPRHLLGKNLQIKRPAVVRQPGDIGLDSRPAAEIGIGREAVERIFVPVELLADPAHAGIAREPIECRPDVGNGHVGVADDRVRPARLVRHCLDPGLRLRPSQLASWPAHRRPSRPRLQRLPRGIRTSGNRGGSTIRTEDARLHRADEPGQISLAPDVEVSIDRPHRPAPLVKCKIRERPPAGCCHFRAGRSSARLHAALRSGLELSVGGQRRKPQHGPGEPIEARRRLDQRLGATALQSVRKHDHKRAAREAREARHRQEYLQRFAETRAAVPVGNEAGGKLQRLLAVAPREARA